MSVISPIQSDYLGRQSGVPVVCLWEGFVEKEGFELAMKVRL